jgi:tetratricopeptide (TPR) repeat protein
VALRSVLLNDVISLKIRNIPAFDEMNSFLKLYLSGMLGSYSRPGNHIRIHVAFSMMVALLVIPIQLLSQKTASEILALPRDEQLSYVLNYYNPGLIKDSMACIQYYSTLQKDFEKKGETMLAQQAWLARLDYHATHLNAYSGYSIYLVNKAIEEARDKGWKQMEAECLLKKGFLLYLQGKWGPAFENIQKGYSQLRKLGFDNTLLIIRYLEEIGKCYYEFGDPEGAIHYLREALAQSRIIDRVVDQRKTMNTIGVCFNRLEQYDSAMHYFTLAHDIAAMAGDTFWAALANGNKGNILMLQGKYDDALPLMEADYQSSIRYGEWSSAVNAALALANIHLQRGEIDKAESYLAYAMKNRNNNNAREMTGFYKSLATISRLKGNYDEAFKAMDSFLVYKERDEKERNIKTINQAKLKVEVENHAHQLQLLETARSRQVLIRNGVLFILLLTLVFASLFIHQQRLRQNKERQLADMRQQAAVTELENAKRQLSFFTNALKEKNELVETFRNELEILHQHETGQSHERIENINALLNSTILTEDDWKSFRQMFDLVHPGFFIRLKEKLADLTPAETRLLALTKLQLAPKEMAAMLGISYDAIKKSRQRLRKKINLPEEGSLDELVELI